MHVDRPKTVIPRRSRFVALALGVCLVLLGTASTAARPASDGSMTSLITSESKVTTPTTMVLFGATGDLASRMIIPSLYKLHAEGSLGKDFRLVAATSRGVPRSFTSDLRAKVAKLGGVDTTSTAWKRFERTIIPQRVDFGEQASVDALNEHIGKERTGVFYLALPPVAFDSGAKALHDAGLIGTRSPKNRIVFEKPFGRDKAESQRLFRAVQRYAPERQVLRMDHYLGKQALLDLAALRFIDKRLESVWNRKHVTRVEISATEALDIQGRARFYDQTGTLRDFVQGHLMQVLAVVTANQPANANALKDEKANALTLVNRIAMDKVVRGQYSGYRATEGVDKKSVTETYVAFQATLKGDRWRGVPFVLESGKAMAEKRTQVRVHFKSLDDNVARDLGLRPNMPAIMTVTIDPEPRIVMRSGRKTVEVMSDVRIPKRQPYERLVLAALTGNSGLFAGSREIEASWNVMDPIEKAWKRSDKRPVSYRKGVLRPNSARALFAPKTTQLRARIKAKVRSAKGSRYSHGASHAKRTKARQRKTRRSRIRGASGR